MFDNSTYIPGEPRSYTGTWIATFLLIAAFVAGLVTFPPLFDGPEGEASSAVLFIGRFHPILLHLPVGALGLLCLIELACVTRRGEEKLGPAALLILWIGAAGSALAVLAGIMLSREGGYEGGNFTLHQTLALIGTAGVLVALVVRILAMGQGNSELLHVYRALFFLAFGIMGLGAHFGGNMTHGNKYLTEHAPEPLKSRMISAEKWMLSFAEKPKPAEPVPPVPPIVPPSPAVADAPAPVPGATPVAAPAAGDKLVFQHVILPILEAKCNKCHNADKAKGDLRMDTFEMALKGGENGSNIVPGKPDESLTMQRIALPLDDDEHMPPEGKDQMTAEEVALLRWWIQEGASSTQKVEGAKFPATTQATVDAVLKG